MGLGRKLAMRLCGALLALATLFPAAQAAERVALVIGNATYAHAPRLLNPGNDAADVAATLGRLGFEVTEKTDLDGLQLRAALRDFQQQANGAEIAVVYYSGHGLGVDGQSWLAPVDARLANQDAVEFETVPLNLVLASVRGARKLRLVVLDACRDNPFIAGMAPRPGRGRSVSRGLMPVAPPRTDTLVWYAARDGSTASDGRGRNSPFTSAFLEHVETPGLELGRLFRQMTVGVQERTSGAQTPWSYGTRGPVDFFLAGATNPNPSLRAEPAVKPEQAAEAAAKQAFDTANATGDPALLDVVAKRYDGTIWGDLASARATTLRDDLGGAEEAAALAASATEQAAQSPRDAEEIHPADARRAPGERFRDCAACPEMIVIPGGTFQMGSDYSEGYDDERPKHRVDVQTFAMGIYEVTFDEWDACVADGYCDGYRPAEGNWRRGKRPVSKVSWNEIKSARGFLSWLNAKAGSEVYRLPTEAEWEYAARARAANAYPWGPKWIEGRANGHEVGTGEAVFVGRYPANDFGLHDMIGNVWEWTEDCWNDSYSDAPSDGMAWASGDCSLAVIRGGSWEVDAEGLRSAVRGRGIRSIRYTIVGFRVSRAILD